MSKSVSNIQCLGGVYRITCLLDGRTYIGSTKHKFQTRWNRHKSELNSGKHGNQYLQNAWNKYGSNVFEFCIIEPIKKLSDLIPSEQKWMDLYQSYVRANGFNISTIAGRPEHNALTRAKISAKHKGRVITPEWRQNISKGGKGKLVSAETRARMSESFSKRKYSAEVKAQMSARRKGGKATEVAKKNMSIAQTGRKHTTETRLKIAASNRRRGISSSTKAKIGNSNASSWLLTTPKGDVITIQNLKQFCRENGLTATCMQRVAYGQATHHKQWQCQKVSNGIS